MPRVILRLPSADPDANAIDAVYVEWSTVVDAPVSYGFPRAAAAAAWGEATIQRCDLLGHSFEDTDAFDPRAYVAHNRAGENESCLSYEDLLEHIRAESADAS